MRKLITLGIVLAFSSGMALGGPLAGAAGVFDGWTGSTSFTDGDNLTGYVDWAVYAPGDFTYAGYAPTAGEMVYAFQLYTTGSDAIHSLTVALANPADNPGSFADLAGDAATSATMNATSVTWTFGGIGPGGNSEGLAFSSPYVPEDYYGIVIDGGSYALVIPLPSPSNVEIPEPATLGLLAMGGLALLRKRRV